MSTEALPLASLEQAYCWNKINIEISKAKSCSSNAVATAR